MPVRPSLLMLVTALLFCFSSCKPAEPDFTQLVEVRGEVTLDARPVTDATIVFLPETAGLKDQFRISYGRTDSAGKFTLQTGNQDEGALPGRHRVLISKIATETKRPAIKRMGRFRRYSGIDFEPVGRYPAAVGEQIPFYYNSESTLTYELVAGRGIERVKFELSSVDPLLTEQGVGEKENAK